VIALATSRVFARSPPGSAQPAAATGVSEAAAVPALPPADGLAEPPAALTLPAAADFEKQPCVLELLLPQPPTASPVATTPGRADNREPSAGADHTALLTRREDGSDACVPPASQCTHDSLPVRAANVHVSVPLTVLPPR
jgi:hypothetical protein